MQSVSQIMQKIAVIASPDSSISSVIKLMEANKISVIPIVEDGKLVGILQENKISKSFGPKEKVREIMQEPIFVCADYDINKASKIMIDKHITRLPVVNNEKEMLFIGIITSTEVAKAIKEDIE
jgi:CBS domain-containing protein